MRCKQELALLTLLVYAVAAPAQSLPAGVKKVTYIEGITEYQLANGLHVLLFPDATHPKVTVNMTYMVGSRQEGYGETGMAHLLEHILFLKTKTRENVKKELTDHGAEFNGSTSWDRTNYFETMTATDENLKYGNEFEAQENSPEGVLFQRVMRASYSWHNYGKPPIGNRSDIENVPINRLAAFYQKYYQPDNALLTIAGKFDEAQALKLVANAFDKIPKPTRSLEATYTIEPAQDGERDVTLRRV